MILIEFHLGLRQVVMALMNWAIDVPQKNFYKVMLDFFLNELNVYFFRDNIFFLFFILLKYIIERFIIHLFLKFIKNFKFGK